MEGNYEGWERWKEIERHRELRCGLRVIGFPYHIGNRQRRVRDGHPDGPASIPVKICMGVLALTHPASTNAHYNKHLRRFGGIIYTKVYIIVQQLYHTCTRPGVLYIDLTLQISPQGIIDRALKPIQIYSLYAW
jgi:hypothetical protein